jgi:hypothetical protein
LDNTSIMTMIVGATGSGKDASPISICPALSFG